MTNEEAKSCIHTIELLRRLAFNVHGVMDVVDAQNCDKIIEMLSKQSASSEQAENLKEALTESDRIYEASAWWENYIKARKKAKEELISKHEALDKLKMLCDGCYLMEHCGQCNPNCLLRKAMDVVEKIKTDSERVSPSEQEKSNSFPEKSSEEAIHEMNCIPALIHCKNCAHSTEWYGQKRRCFLWHEDGIDVWEDGYCNYADRKEKDVPDIHVGKTDFQPGDKFILELGEERRMFGEFEIKGTDLYVKTDLLEKLTRYEPEEKTEKIPYKKPEIIYCTECKKGWDSGTATINGQSCRIFKCSVWERPVSPFGYCYMAERRNDG